MDKPTHTGDRESYKKSKVVGNATKIRECGGWLGMDEWVEKGKILRHSD